MMLHPEKTVRRRRGRPGQALTEFAIVVPVMVTTFLFAIYFYEVIQIKLKAQEIARFAAWEFTSYPLHDYKDGKTNKFADSSADIKSDIGRRYANLRSGHNGNQDKGLNVGWDPVRVQLRDQLEPKIPGGSLVNQIFNVAGYIVDFFSMMSFQHRNIVLTAMMAGYWSEKYKYFGSRLNRFNPPRKWGFNTRGYAKATISLRYRNLAIGRFFMDKGSSGWFGKKHFTATRFVFRENVAVVADSWRMNYGEDIKMRGGRNKPYWNAVDRMAFVTPSIRNGLKLWTGVIQFLSGTIAVIAQHAPLVVDPLETTLVSVNYKEQNPNSGKVDVNEDHGTVRYDSSPANGKYKTTIQVRGEYHMGCLEPEKLGCHDSLSSDNPFGDYVAPPEH